MELGELEKLDTIFLIGSDIRREQPLGGHRVRKAALKGAQVIALNPIDYEFNYNLSAKLIVPALDIPRTLAGIAKHICPKDKELKQFFTAEPTEQEIAIAESLLQRPHGALLLGVGAISHPEATMIRILAGKIAEKTGMTLGCLPEGANAPGAWLAGMIPHRGPGGALTEGLGLDISQMFSKGLKSYLLLNVEPELDFIKPAQALSGLSQAEFVVALTPFITEAQEQYADVLLPIAPFFEMQGSFINITNHWQQFGAVTNPLTDAKPAWKIFRVLGNLFHLEGFDQTDIHQVTEELKNSIDTIPPVSSKLNIKNAYIQPQIEGLYRLSEWPIYHIDNLVRRAISLQEWALDENLFGARVNEQIAKQYNLNSGEMISIVQEEDQLDIPVFIDNRIAGDCILLPAGIAATAGFGEHLGPIKLLRGRVNV